MNMNLKSPCNNCPFRTDNVFLGLDPERKQEIWTTITDRQATFTCHKTTQRSEREQEHCAGAMIVLERMDRPNQWMRWMERLGEYDRTKLNMDAPLVETLDEWIELDNLEDRT